MSNQVTQAVTEEASYQLFKNLFRFKDIKAAQGGLQRAVEARYEDAGRDEEAYDGEAGMTEAFNQRAILAQLQQILAQY